MKIVKLTLETGVFEPVIDQFVARMDALGFSTLEVANDFSSLTVDASSDPSEYSVLMAAVDAAAFVGVSEDSVIDASIKH